jgi:hypothetical protein
MILTAVLTGFALLGLYLEYKGDYIEEAPQKYKWKKYILVIGVLAIIGNSFKQSYENKNSQEDIDTLNFKIDNLTQINKSLNYNLDSIFYEFNKLDYKYDSLLIHNKIINKQLSYHSSQIKALEKLTDDGFKSNEQILKTLDTKNLNRDRVLTIKQQTVMINQLLKLKNQTVLFKYKGFGSEENVRYAKQFISVFKKAGWKVEENFTMITLGNITEEITICVKTLENDELLKNLRILGAAFTKAGLKYKTMIDPNIKSEDTFNILIAEG